MPSLKRLCPAGLVLIYNSACDSNPDSPECTRSLQGAAPIVVGSDRKVNAGNGLSHEQVVEQERTGTGKQHPISSYKRQRRGGNNDSGVNEQQQPVKKEDCSKGQ